MKNNSITSDILVAAAVDAAKAGVDQSSSPSLHSRPTSSITGNPQSVVTLDRDDSKDDMWGAVQEAIEDRAKDKHSYLNDTNNNGSSKESFGLRDFRRNLSILKRTQLDSDRDNNGDVKSDKEDVKEEQIAPTEQELVDVDEDKEEKKVTEDELGETVNHVLACSNPPRHAGLALSDHGDEVNEDVFAKEVKSRGTVVMGAGTVGMGKSRGTMGMSAGPLKQSLMQAAIAEAQSFSTTLPTRPPQRRGDWGRTSEATNISDLLQKANVDAAKHWARTFYHLDPRWQILTFFIDLALEGMENLEHNDGIISVDCREKFPLLLRAFAKVGVFSVWRPTSNDAIRKMVTGDGVGKGLDIKGKSALKGKYSGFVPFLQISNNEDKAKVCGMTAGGRLRIFYPNESSRDKAVTLLKPLRNKMVQLVGEAENTMSDPRIHKIDDYASSSDKGAFGLEIPEKLFWEGYVVRNDVTREVGSEYDTGRPSMPEFQGMNLDTLRKIPQKNGNSDPHPVLYHAGCGSKSEFSENANPLCPLDLLMAYEENDDVTAVVSDFDCFLVGTRGVKFNESLGQQEHSMLIECVDEIEGILSTPREGIGWTKRWLEVKKKQFRNDKSGKHQEMPKFGYADPRSYTMMKGAVHRLNGSGAVRHGPECFNYGFPQELDDSFLVISDTLPGKVPWKYVNAAELKDILRDRIEEGFTFPMNPKWILCDPGWKLLYDKLLASDRSDTQESMGIWYPEDIQRRINEISTKFPDGFVHCNDRDHHEDSGVSVDLAQMELKRYELRRSGIGKVRSALTNLRIEPEDKEETCFLTTVHMLQIGKEVDLDLKSKEAGMKLKDDKLLAVTEQSTGTKTETLAVKKSNDDKDPSKHRRKNRRASLTETMNKRFIKPFKQLLSLPSVWRG